MKRVLITITSLSILFSIHAQNIGIGTITPYSKLHVNGTSWFQGDNTPLSASAGKGIAIGYGSVGYIYSYDYLTNQPKDLILQHAGGNLGIGTTIPAAKLHLVKDNEAMRIQGSVPYISFFDNAGVYKGFVSQSPGSDMAFGTAGGNVSGSIGFWNNNIKNLAIYNNGLAVVAGTSATLELWDDGYRSGVIEADGTNRLEISASRTEAFGASPGNLILQTGYQGNFGPVRAGKVGIGTSTPDYKVTIFSNTIESNSNTHILKVSGQNPVVNFCDETGISYGYLKSWTYAPYAPFSKGMVIGSNPGYPIFFSTNNYSASMTVADNGNVGIGTVYPTSKLSVNGNIQSKEVVVETGWADYVFDENYDRPSLAEVEEFIKNNKHLPQIPSAKEIKEKGLSLGEMQKKMMVKIEELTLYIIELKKEIEKIKSNKQ